MTRRRHSLLYLLYLRSPLWRLRRRVWILRTGGRCERCGGRRRLTIHHRSCRRLGHERRSDVEVLCWPCHRAQHDRGAARPARRWRMRLVRRVVAIALAVLVLARVLVELAAQVPHR
jgi:5-methylcytosine-specific restriction endonuclease McrA